MEINKITDLSYELASIIKESTAFQLLKKYEREVFENIDTKTLLDEFLKNKEQYNEISKYNGYYPGSDKIKKAFQQAKINLMNNDLFKKYKDNEKIIDKELKEIEDLIRSCLNITDRHGKGINL